MCRLAVVTPIVWCVRVDRLIEHLEQGNIEQYKWCSERYRDIDVRKVSHFSTTFAQEILYVLFNVEVLVGLDDYDSAMQLLNDVKNKIVENGDDMVSF
jgi:hypothetical protein